MEDATTTTTELITLELQRDYIDLLIELHKFICNFNKKFVSKHKANFLENLDEYLESLVNRPPWEHELYTSCSNLENRIVLLHREIESLKQIKNACKELEGNQN